MELCRDVTRCSTGVGVLELCWRICKWPWHGLVSDMLWDPGEIWDLVRTSKSQALARYGMERIRRATVTRPVRLSILIDSILGAGISAKDVIAFRYSTYATAKIAKGVTNLPFLMSCR